MYIAIDCLYSLSGGLPGFALRRFLQVKVLMQRETFIIENAENFCKIHPNFYVALYFSLKNKMFSEYSLLLFSHSWLRAFLSQNVEWVEIPMNGNNLNISQAILLSNFL